MCIVEHIPFVAVGLGTAFTVIWGVADPVMAFAEIKTFTADGYYIMGDGPEENMTVAKERARVDAMRVATELAGVYVESISETKNGRLTRDEIRTISANVIEVQSDDVKIEVVNDNIIRIHCHMVAKVKADNVAEQLLKDRGALAEAVRKNKELEDRLEAVNEELRRIKSDYKNASEFEKNYLINEIKVNEDKFLAFEWNEKGVEYYAKGLFENALDCYQKSIEFDSKYASPWCNIGSVYNNWNLPEKALVYLYAAVKLDSKNVSAWNNMGHAYLLMGYLDKAIECCEKALSINQNLSKPWDNMCHIYIDKKNYCKAIECGLRAVDLAPDDIMALNNLGVAFNRNKQHDKAVEYIKRAIKLSPKSPSLWNNLGNVYFDMGQYKDAVYAFNKAMELNPTNKLYRDNYEVAYKQMHLYK